MSSTLDTLKRLVSTYRKSSSSSEIEIRLGQFSKNKFIPGIRKEDFDCLLTDLLSCKGLAGEETWEEVIDYYYNTKAGKVRTRVTFNSQKMSIDTEHILKSLKEEEVFVHEKEADVAFRVAVSKEVAVSSVPNICLPTSVRLKQRRTFFDSREGKKVWVYELSKTWSACSRSAVEHAQMMNPPKYEVECELIDEGNAYMKSNDDDYVGKSFLLKAQLLLGEEGEDVCFLPALKSNEEVGRKRKTSSES